ncbi:MgtC/SapB family protein [Anaerovorax odorimutans]|uniref:MgtC/SapB family protein n=1 Tax=Anaerovorax odorimutans TaxID=109327 RepID=A0ABT1RQ45_9FIRM|nr:MgtC/SapB family protein [Anaerovorax odorimutans]MCQ4637283.1 MgtC/SapB family protein [Anaerovorax odorimutans]
MYTLPDCFYNINLFSTAFRLVLAVIFGGIIGLERGANRHPAGFRTHILVCVGATLAMLTNEYICQIYGSGDPARLGAQVITGVGFLGVGTILVTGRHKIKGLTTAAGLWASACLGLALGIGFYSGAIIAAAVIFISLALLPKIENYFYRNSRAIDLYIEIDSVEHFRAFIKHVRTVDAAFYETHLSQDNPVSPGGIAFHLSMILPKNMGHSQAIDEFSHLEGVYIVEEI